MQAHHAFYKPFDDLAITDLGFPVAGVSAKMSEKIP